MIIKFLKKKFNSIKICAVFTAVCFMVSTLGANLYAIPMTENAKQKYEDVFNKASSISNEYGKITSSKDAQSDITVINIQDLHCHPQTQRNIAKIIGQIADKYNLKKIYVEGGYGDIDVSWLGSIKDENIKKKIIEELVEEGILTGSEYYKLISNNDKVELKGIDERQLHQDNIKRLSLIIENQDKYKELSKKINKEISFLEQKYVNIRNKRFNSNIEDYLSGKIDTRRFYRQLLKYIKDINVNPEEYNNVTAIRLEDYPNISKFMTLRKVSKNINVRDVTQQLQIVLSELKSRMPYNTYTRLLKETDNFSDSQKVVELVTLLCEKEGIDLDRKYKALSEFLNSNEINRELNTVELVYEERQLITEIRKALSYNNEEYEITFVSDFSRYFQDYLEYKLTDADWKYFESEYKQFRQLYGKYATVDRIKEIESDIAELNKYYEINDQRNEIFVNNLLQDEEPTILQQSKLRQDEEILKQSKEVIIAVTGGFHSQALEEILQAKEVNTIVITPSIFEGIEKATKQYKGIIKEQSKEFQHQALAYTLASCSDSVVYKRIKDREQVPSDYAIVREEDDGSVVVAEHFQKRILLNAVVRILGTKDVVKIREVLEPIMGKEALKNLEEDINSLEDIGEKFDAKYEPFKNAIDAAVDSIVDSMQTTGNLVLPNQATIDRAMTGLVASLISVGQIYFSNGVIFEIENSEFYGKDLAGIPAEIYSRMMPTFQRALLLFQASRTSTVPLNTSSLESDDKIVIVQPRQAADGKTETYDEELSLTVEDLLYIGLNDDNEWSFLTPKSVSERTENLRERKRQTGILSKAEKKLKENQVPNYTGDVVDLRIKLKKTQLNKQVVYLSDIFGRQVLIKRKDNNGNDVYCEAIIKYNEETRQWELVPFEEINARYKSIEDGLLSKIEDFTKQFEGKTPEEILKEHPVILQLVILAIVRGFSIDHTLLDNKTITLGGVKGYFAEYLVKYFTETLDDQYRLVMPIDSNQEGFDLIDKDGYRIQIKAAAKRIDNADPDKRDIVGHALHKFKGIPVFATSEIASEYKADTDMVFSYGFSHEFIESIAKVAFDILNNLTPQEKEDLKTKTTGKVIETRYLSEFLKDKDLEARAQQERANDEQEEVRIRGSRNEQKKADIKTVDAAVYQTFIDLLKTKLNIADEQVTMQPKLGVEEKTQQEEIQQEETATPKSSKLSIFDSRRGEGKIFDFLDATAPLWEELYRFIPTVLSIGLYSVAILPFLPALGWTAIPITIGISFAVFNMFQRNFIKKHIITDWLKTKDSDIEEIKTWKEFLSFLYERIKIYTFEIFPSKLEKEQFEYFYKNDAAAVAHRNGLMVPTIGISLPYLILICAMTICSTIPSFQIIMIVTLVASLMHYANNKLIETGFSLFPKEKEKQKDLRYIRGRLQYVRLLLEYPQLKNNLPVITNGPRAEKYGVETLKERRAEYLEQFESIRQKLIKEAEKDHPKIKQELILMDAKKVSETIDAIDKLLPIFEEIDNIVDLIEEYKDNYEGAREAREIEKAFFIFVSDVLSKELMSIYDTKVTGDHVRRMVAFANVLGEIAYPDASLKFRYRLMLAALFHDIGKNLIPDSVLNSQNGFDATEKHIMDFHSVFGDIILRASILQKLGYFAGNHHAAKNAKRGYSYESKLREISEQPIDFKRDENDKAEDDLILEIIALADVYEALSPKLSMDSERLYQLPTRIESIKNILAALDFRGNLTEQKQAVKLLEEIAAIEQEKDETTKQKREKEFVEKVLYSNNSDSLLMYIRNKNEDFIRNRAFKIIFTQDQNTLFDLFEEDKDKFIKDLTANPEIVKNMSLELIDWTKFEFDEETIGAFLEFYFTSMDVDINNQIIDEMVYRKKENVVSLYIRNAILNFRKRQRERQKRLQRILSRYTPVKLSIFDGLREKGAQTDFEKYFKGKTVVVEREQTKTGTKSYDILKFDETKVYQVINRLDYVIPESNYDSFGIIVERDTNGKIISLRTKEGFRFSSSLIDGEPAGDEKNNLSFSPEQTKVMLQDTGATGTVGIYLDDFDNTDSDSKNNREQLIEQISSAKEKNQLLVIHIFRKGYKTEDLSLGQLLDKYNKAYSLIQAVFAEAFSDTLESEKEKIDAIKTEELRMLDGIAEEIRKKILEEEGYDWTKRETATSTFAIEELLKNNFGHGNLGLFEYPMACYFSSTGEIVTYDSAVSYSAVRNIGSDTVNTLLKNARIFGDGAAMDYMKAGLLRTIKVEPSFKFKDSTIKTAFYKATSVLKEQAQIEEEKQKRINARQKRIAQIREEFEKQSMETEAEKQKRLEREKREREERMRREIEEMFMQTASTVAKLYNRGLNKYLRKYLEKTGKAVENLTEEELSQIQKDAKNYRFTFPGIFYGVFLETFALFSKGFIAAHGEMSFGMKIVVWTVRALSIGIGLTAAFMSLSVLPVATLLSAVAFPIIFGVTTISSGFVIHLLWNIGAVLTNNKGSLLQTGSDVLEQKGIIKNRLFYDAIGNIKNFFNRGIEIVYKNGTTKQIMFIPEYNYEDEEDKNKEDSFLQKEVIKRSRYFNSGMSYGKDSKGKVGYTLTLNKNWVTDTGNSLFIRKEGGPYEYKIKNVTTNEEIILKLDMSSGKFKILSVTVKISKDNELYDKYKLDHFVVNVETNSDGKETIRVDMSFEKDSQVYSINIPSDNDGSITYIQRGNYIFRFENGFVIPKQIYSLQGIDDIDKIIVVDELGDLLITDDDILYMDMERNFRIEDFKDRNFVIQRSNGDEHMLYFDSEDNTIYEIIDHLGTRVVIENLSDYGILSFHAENGEITELILEYDADMGIDVRQPIEIRTEVEIKDRMEEFATGHIRNLNGLSVKQLIPILKRACPKLTEEDFKRLIRTGHLDEEMKEKIRATNYQGDITLEYIDFSDEIKLMQALQEDSVIYSMFIEAVIRTIEALKKQEKIDSEIKIDKNSTLEELIETIYKVIDGNNVSTDYFETQFRGYFGEIYCTKTIVAGVFDGIVLRLQMPDASNEPGIDLIDPVTGMKIQVKTGKKDIVDEHLKKNWRTKEQDKFFKSGNFGPKMIPVLTVRSLKVKDFADDSKVQSFGLDSGVITNLLKVLLKYNDGDKKLDENKLKESLIGNLRFIDDTLSAENSLLEIINRLELVREKEDNYKNAILTENMGIVNRMLQQGKSAFVAATVIAFKEFRASLKPNFVDLHQSESGRKGAQQLRNFITRFDVVETDSLATRIIKTILGTIVKGASIVKHITIDYRFIKASGITEAIKMFGSNTYLDENGNVHIPPVMIVDDLQQVQGELIPTGISVNGRSIYQVAENGMLIYGAQGIAGVDVSKAINESQMIKDAIENIIRAKGYEGIKVEVEGVIQEEGEGVRFEDGITIIGTQELQGKSIEYVNGFISSSLEIKRSMGVMYSQKALISLESMDDMEKLEQALKQGRTRKIISKSQYEQLQLTPEEIITMRENGIEIYIDSNEIDSNLKENGIVGQIIRKDGQIFIHDYYTQEEVEVEEIGEEDSLLNIENKLVNSQKPILIDIKVLAKQFQKENILGVYKGLNTLIGNIKIKTGIGTINQADIENLAYNIDYNRIPDLGTLSKEKLEALTIDELIKMLNIAENSEIRIILKAIRKNQNLDENGFVNIIKERILAKAVLKENNKEFGLKDKKMEILLGKMLLKQLGNQDKQNVNIPDSFTGEKDNVIKKIMEETEKAMKGDEVAVNTIIEIILVYGDSYKNKQMAKELDANDARNYRAMMAAA